MQAPELGAPAGLQSPEQRGDAALAAPDALATRPGSIVGADSFGEGGALQPRDAAEGRLRSGPCALASESRPRRLLQPGGHSPSALHVTWHPNDGRWCGGVRHVAARGREWGALEAGLGEGLRRAGRG